jgi:hypothetical protein
MDADIQSISSSDSIYDSDSSIVIRINSVLRDLKCFRKCHHIPARADEPLETKTKMAQVIPLSQKSDTPTLRNVQTIVAVFLEQGFVNQNGSPFPLRI